MSITSRHFAPFLAAAGAAASIAVAPVAVADSGVLPLPGSENASATISDIKAQGYDVQINWVNGYPYVSLSQCWVNGINPNGGSGELKIAYVDVECPH